MNVPNVECKDLTPLPPKLIYYGFYGPFQTRVEQILVRRMNEMVSSLRAKN